MNFGFDGKRAFENKTGLGNYIRVLLPLLQQYFPTHHYTLFAPKKTGLFNHRLYKNTTVITPQNFFHRKIPGLWRRGSMVKDIQAAGIHLYHGVSNELPQGLQKTGVKKVVTVHDLIFERFPQTYSFDERYVHRWKIKHACTIADTIIAISRQTKADLINIYKIPEKKIEVCYQSCNPIFKRVVGEKEKEEVKRLYNLPPAYFLFVGAITKRKNLLTICKAIVILKNRIDIPLVVLGNGNEEKKVAQEFMLRHGIGNRMIFLNELPQSKQAAFTTAAHFPAIYQQATALIYPSIFEGFGIPLLEAMASKIPIICSNASCLPEVGGNAALYFDALDAEQLATQMFAVTTNSDLRKETIEKGLKQLQLFTEQVYATSVMNVYQKIIDSGNL